MDFELEKIEIRLPEGQNMIFGQSHFIKTVEDLYETLIESAPNINFGIGFCEASGPCLVRSAGNDDILEREAAAIAKKIGCGHSFVILLRNFFPVSVLNRVKSVSEVCSIYCATSNKVDVIVAVTPTGRGVMGVVDGCSPKGLELDHDKHERKAFLRNVGYKQ